MTEVFEQRLEKLALKLENFGWDKDHRFDMNAYGYDGDNNACAIGWALREGWFVEEGFKREPHSAWVVPFGCAPSSYPELGTYFRCVAAFFGLTYDQAEMLFDSTRRDVEREVRMIRRVGLAMRKKRTVVPLGKRVMAKRKVAAMEAVS